MLLMEPNQLKLEDIYSSDSVVCFEAVRRIKNSVIGSNRLKGLVLEQGAAGRLVALMNITNGDVAREAMIVVASLAKGTEQHLRQLIEANAVPTLLVNTQAEQFAFVEASLRCLRTIFKSRLAPVELIYSGIGALPSATSTSTSSSASSSSSVHCSNVQQSQVLPHLISLASNPKSSYVVRECIANILAASCRTTEHQNVMKDLDAVPLIAQFISDQLNPYQVRLAALNWLAQLCRKNACVARLVIAQKVPSGSNDQSMVETLYEMMGKSHTHEMQFYAAKCYTYLYRANVVLANDTRLLKRTLPTLIMLCKKDQPATLRAQAANVLASLMKVDVTLQQTASICDQLLSSLSDMLRQSSSVTRVINALDSNHNNGTPNGTHHNSSHNHNSNSSNNNSNNHSAAVTPTNQQTPPPPPPPQSLVTISRSSSSLPSDESSHSLNSMSGLMDDPMGDSDAVTAIVNEGVTHSELRIGAFKAFASLGSNDEEIRKKIIETEYLLDEIMSSLDEPNIKVKLAALRCLHSLSRSVSQLRTTFQDHAVWIPLRNMLQNSKDEKELNLASSILCNLLLEFSASKQHFLDRRSVEMLCNLTRNDYPNVRRNGVWALMNMAFQAEHSIKTLILSCLGIDQMFTLLLDSDVNILMKTLGLLRNLLSNKPHIDQIMNEHGKQIMSAIILILEGDHDSTVKEQALCILQNIAGGGTAKESIMSNEDILKKLISYIMHGIPELKMAAVCCVNNLIWTEEEGSHERKEKLRELSVPMILQQLLNNNPSNDLYERVKQALNHFNLVNPNGGAGGTSGK